MLRKKIATLYSAAGKEVTDDMKMEELVKPSIFDTDEIKETKVFIVEIQEYIDEIAFLEANKEALKKEQEAKELAKKADPNNPDGFGKPQANADQFRTTGFTLKKKPAPADAKDDSQSKKRTFQEMQQEQKAAGIEATKESNGEKRQKGSDEPPVKSGTTDNGKENALSNQV